MPFIVENIAPYRPGPDVVRADVQLQNSIGALGQALTDENDPSGIFRAVAANLMNVHTYVNGLAADLWNQSQADEKTVGLAAEDVDELVERLARVKNLVSSLTDQEKAKPVIDELDAIIEMVDELAVPFEEGEDEDREPAAVIDFGGNKDGPAKDQEG